jgi:hypothetical protein
MSALRGKTATIALITAPALCNSLLLHLMFLWIAKGYLTDLLILYGLAFMAAVSLYVVHKTVRRHSGMRLMGFILAWTVLGAASMEINFCLHLKKGPGLFSADHFVGIFWIMGMNLAGYGGAAFVFLRHRSLLRMWRAARGKITLRATRNLAPAAAAPALCHGALLHALYVLTASGAPESVLVAAFLGLMAAVSLVVVVVTVQSQRRALLLWFVAAWSVLDTAAVEINFMLHEANAPGPFSAAHFQSIFAFLGFFLMAYGGVVLAVMLVLPVYEKRFKKAAPTSLAQ